MIYLNEKNLVKMGIVWGETIGVIEAAVKCLKNEDFAQPIKPYLRYRGQRNRIIAMPAFIGGDMNVAGIKWIASFPDNIQKGIPRAHSVVILNHSETGQPVAVINTALLSIIRTASVSGLMMKYFDKVRPLKDIKVGIIGWGPIGQHHFKVCTDFFGDRISRIHLYDKRPIIHKDTIDFPDKGRIVVEDHWEKAYKDADIFITCTVSPAPYIDQRPKDGSLQLNVSLRDYKTDIYEFVKNSIIVDDWEEVCREKTDIEAMHIEKGLVKEDTKSVIDVVCNGCLQDYACDMPIMFNPMGMAVFDMAIGAYYLNKSLQSGIGQKLE